MASLTFGETSFSNPRCRSETDFGLRQTNHIDRPCDSGTNSISQEREQIRGRADVVDRRGNPLFRFFDSGVPTAVVNTFDRELDEIKEGHGPQSLAEYDACQEYSYSYTEDEDTSDCLHNQNDSLQKNQNFSLISGKGIKYSDLLQTQPPPQTATPASNDMIYILGRRYHSFYDYNARRTDESSLFWFTYRCDFPVIDPYGITSDAGWGCMLRATQMLLAQALKLHYRGRDWRPPTSHANQSLSVRRSDPFIRSILTWFADFPSSNMESSGDFMYSLHNMVGVGKKYDKLPGEWYGPGTACYVLRDLVLRHEKQQQQSVCNQPNTNTASSMRRIFRVHVASSDGAVYRNEIRTLMTRDKKKSLAQHTQQQIPIEGNEVATKTLPSHPLEDGWDDDFVDSEYLQSKREVIPWDTALLLLIPLRLGLKSFNTDYVEIVAHTFSLPQSVGVLGGRPRGARWFYGAQVNGEAPRQIFGLDPHTVQASPRRRNALVNGFSKQVVELTDEYLSSVHTTFTETFSLEKMDPSIALGFYCKDNADLEQVFDNLQEWRKAHPNSPELFHVHDAQPDYEYDDMMMTIDENNDDGMMPPISASTVISPGADSSDDEEYVLL